MSGEDQAVSDHDQAASDHDQEASDHDQRASDIEQDLANREHEGHPPADADRKRVHEEAEAARAEGGLARMATTANRSRGASGRHEQGEQRDSTARRRDEVALDRDRAAAQAEATAVQVKSGKDADADTAAARARAAAAAVRVSAAKEREGAAEVREVAAQRRDSVTSEIERTMMDEPSGAYGRQIGAVLISHELVRARRTGAPLALGLVRLGEITQIEERHNGDPARRTRDRDLFIALQTRLPLYVPIVRWSNTEFVCVLLDKDGDAAKGRLEEACSDLAQAYPGASIAIGVAGPTGEDDTPDTLVERARRSCHPAP